MPKPPKRKSRAPQLHDTAASGCNLPDFSAPKYKLLHLGDTALAVELGDGIDRAVSAQVLALGRRLKRSVWTA